MRLFIALLSLIATPVFADINPGPPLRDECYADVIATAFDGLTQDSAKELRLTALSQALQLREVCANLRWLAICAGDQTWSEGIGCHYARVDEVQGIVDALGDVQLPPPFDDLRKSLETVLASGCGDLRRPPRDQVSDADADSFCQFRRDINMAITLSALAQIAYETEALWERD